MISIWNKISFLCHFSIEHSTTSCSLKSITIKSLRKRNKKYSMFSKISQNRSTSVIPIFLKNTSFYTTSMMIYHTISLNKSYLIWLYRKRWITSQHPRSGCTKDHLKSNRFKIGLRVWRMEKFSLIIAHNLILKLTCIPINLQERTSNKF